MQTQNHITDAVPRELLDAATQFTGGTIDAAVILGSGLGHFHDSVACERSMPTTALPGYPCSTVIGHAGQLHLCRLGSQRLLLFDGRIHGYEGYAPDLVTLPVRLSAALGASKLLVTNAAGGLHPSFAAGDFMLINDLLSLPVTQGMGLPLAVQIPDDVRLPRPLLTPASLAAARRAAAELGVPLREGTYAFCAGPTYETRSEIGFFRMAGADAVGMSTLPEIITARLIGIDVLGISCITNKALTVPQIVSHAEVTTVAAQVSERFALLVRGILERW